MLLTNFRLHEYLNEAAQAKAIYCLILSSSNDLLVELRKVFQRFLVLYHVISQLSLVFP